MLTVYFPSLPDGGQSSPIVRWGLGKP
ncbi:hypothetical protein GA0115246_108871, partial [Streptomyces sp. SolWspMP-sol7th]